MKEGQALRGLDAPLFIIDEIDDLKLIEEEEELLLNTMFMDRLSYL